MVGEAAARDLARKEFAGEEVVLGPARELEQGWYFSAIGKGADDVHEGVFVDKTIGRTLLALTQGDLAADPTLYDRGFRFSAYDLVVLAVHDRPAAVRVLAELHIRTVDVYYRNERVYRVGRNLTEAEVAHRLADLPAVFDWWVSSSSANSMRPATRAGWTSGSWNGAEKGELNTGRLTADRQADPAEF